MIVYSDKQTDKPDQNFKATRDLTYLMLIYLATKYQDISASGVSISAKLPFLICIISLEGMIRTNSYKIHQLHIEKKKGKLFLETV